MRGSNLPSGRAGPDCRPCCGGQSGEGGRREAVASAMRRIAEDTCPRQQSSPKESWPNVPRNRELLGGNVRLELQHLPSERQLVEVPREGNPTLQLGQMRMHPGRASAPSESLTMPAN